MLIPLLGGVVAAAVGSWAAYSRSPAARSRRRALRGLREVRRRERSVARFLGAFRRRLARVARRLRADEAEAELQRAPVEELRRFGARRVRYDALREAGLETVGALVRKTRRELEEIHGIGSQSADQLRAAVKECRAHREERPLALPSPELDSRAERRLARATVAYASARDSLRDAPMTLARGAADGERQARSVRRQLGLLSWLTPWGRGGRIERGRAAAGSLEEAMASVLARPEVSELDPSLARAREEGKRRRSRRDLGRHLEENRASCALALQLAGRPEPRTAAEREAETLGAPVEAAQELDAGVLEEILHTELEPQVMSAHLRQYQLFGTRFLLARRRTLLGDEMGLGKTIQSLAALAHVWARHPGARFLVVAPASLLYNWLHEVEDKTHLPARIAHGTRRESAIAAWLQGGGVLIHSYAGLRSSSLLARLEGQEEPMDFLVADEAHFVKNPEASRSQAVGTLSALARRVVFLSGTPMENHPREFAELLERLAPRPAPRLPAELWDRAESPATSAAFRRAVAGVYLRRNQEDVLLELPERIEMDEWVEMTPAQERAYRVAVGQRNFMGMRQAVTRQPEGGDCGKQERLAELLAEHAEEGRKVLIFSYFLKVLAELAEAHPHIGVISGSVAPEERERIIQSFRDAEGSAVLLAQITAAGTGLNLQAASVVILMEPQLTPGTEAQAIARAHRMGQTRKVLVHRLLAEDSVDARIVELLREKRALFEEYARQSVSKEEHPAATETSLVRTIIEMEEARLGGGVGSTEPRSTARESSPAEEGREETAG